MDGLDPRARGFHPRWMASSQPLSRAAASRATARAVSSVPSVALGSNATGFVYQEEAERLAVAGLQEGGLK
jgi:hypothetical protein